MRELYIQWYLILIKFTCFTLTENTASSPAQLQSRLTAQLMLLFRVITIIYNNNNSNNINENNNYNSNNNNDNDDNYGSRNNNNNSTY